MRKSSQYLVVVRHGRTLANVLTARPTDEHFYAVVGSDRTLGLTPTGELQSKSAGRRLAKLFPVHMPIAKLFHSDFLRTKITTEAICEQLPYHVDVVSDARISKRSYGDFWNITYAGVEALYPGEHALYAEQGAFDYRPPNGENYPDLIKRVSKFMDERIDKVEGNIGVVTHAAVCLVIDQHVSGFSDLELLERYNSNYVDNCEIVVYRRKTSNHPWQKCSLWWYRLRCKIASLPTLLSRTTKAS